MDPFKCIVALLSLSLVLAVPQAILDETDASVDLQEPQQDQGGLKGKKIVEPPQKAERAFSVGQTLNQGIDQGVGLAQEIGKGIKSAFGNLFGKGPKRCDPARPHSAHPTNCYMFFHCVDRLNGIEQVEKTCNPPTMFNPETMVCDWPESVMRIRPECAFADASSSARSSAVPPSSGLKAPSKLTPNKNAPLFFKGGCTERPPTPANANVKCSPNSGNCDVKCLEDFSFPDKSTQMQIRCEAPGVWRVANWDKMPDCEPICMPPCQNLGFCIAPGVCNCPDNFEGSECQFAKSKPCLDKPPTPMNSRVVCNEKECISTCNRGFTFPGGSKKLTMICDSGNWIQRNQQPGTFQKVPDCQPVCDPPCANGGRCLPNNFCECPQEFRGPQCNYPVENCAPERMNFNGGYNCSGGSASFSCSLNCGADGVFEFPPAPRYTCEYAKAQFVPDPIPQCIFESQQVQYFKSNSTSHSQMLIEQSSELEWNGQQTVKEETEWSLIPSGKGVWTKKQYEKYFENFFSGGSNGEYVINIPEDSLVRETAAQPGTCLAWGGAHYKTFDGKVYSVHSDCSYVMLRDAVASTFSVIYGVHKCPSNSNCKRFVNVLVEDFTYEIDTNANGVPYVRKGDQSLTLPNQVDGLLFERVANFVIVQAEGLGFTVKWDTKATVTIDVNHALWNRTAGLCGRINGMWVDDFENRDGTRGSSLLGFVNSWEASGLTDQCQSNPNEKHACKWDTPQDQQVSNEATQMCEHILKDEKFEKCRKVVDPRSYYEACRWDYCQCSNSNREDCACSALETYFHECLRHNVELPDGWRSPSLCPIDCQNGRVYKMCGPISDETCSSPVTAEPVRPTDLCIEGCYCPKGSALHKDQCIPRSECPCTLRQKTYQPSEQVPNDCNTCTCVAGEWQCTDVRCGSRCAVLGDPHYTTFDGQHYDFMGKCSYYLMKGDNYSIEAENVPCSGAISQAMNYPVKSLSTVPSCTKTVTIRTDGGDVIKLKQDREVTVNGEEVLLQPSVWIDGVVIRHASSVFLAVELPNGLEIWWDGLSRVYIDAPPTFFGTTKGLCGTFNENQRDDMTTPEGDVEQSVAAFANSWKTKEVCQDASIDLEPIHPCELNGHKKAETERQCAKIKDAIFEPCHQVVDPEPYYRDCLYDVCSCQVKLGECLCPTIAAYAKECSQKGVLVDWIPEVRECGVHCRGGQTYQVCANSCARTCYDIALYPKCRRKCVEGCNCPEGQTLDPFGLCIPIHECPCIHKGIEYQPGHKELRPGARSPDLCTCISARWHCQPATPEERDLLANVTLRTQMECRSSHNEEYTSCEPERQLTCKTMGQQVSMKKPVECRPGCQCKKGYVFDPTSKTCIKPSECPCHHAGRSYSENNRITQDCNTCTCHSGKWECTKNQCPGICSNWGESHYKTFDGKQYDFHGNCDYMMAKGAATEPNEKFHVTVQSVPCGSSGVACSKSVTLRLGSAGAGEESITLTRHKKIPLGKFSERILVREAGLFIFIEVADLGLVLQWDHGTRIYLRLDPKWKGRVRGLCGNFNDNALDDFQPPSGGITEVDARVFGDSWRLQKYCPETPSDYIDTCTLHPHRKVWSVMKCSLLKSSLFEKCHAEVPVEYYVEKCVLDSCGCDMGGDCECLCTSFAEYAQACNAHGIAIRWRSQELCPLQCNEECSFYSPCMSTCPTVTCDNPLGSSSLCAADTCVEGCKPKECPKGQIHRSANELSCMPISDCASALCMVVDGVMYAEGDVIERDACHACYCSKGKRVCQGQPCYVPSTTASPVTIRTTAVPVSNTTIPEMGISTCRTGWSEWINTHHPKEGGDRNDVEPIPNRLNPGLANAPVCHTDHMVDIECRASQSKISHKKTGDNVDCNLKTGLECTPGGIKGRSVCHDYEIRILCDCSEMETRKPVFVEPTTKATPITKTSTRSPVASTKIASTPISIKVEPTTPVPILGRCDPARPNSPHPTSCHLFYQCVDRIGGVEQVEKTCQPPTMYNPDTMVCDWPEAVIRIRPDCGSITPTTTKKPATAGPCVDGWTDWFSVTSPSDGTGDFEIYEKIVLQHPMCPKSHIRDIECKYMSREAGSKKKSGQARSLADYRSSPDRNVQCTVSDGLICYNSDQDSGLCQDYKVRFLCRCEEDVYVITSPDTPTTEETVTTTEPPTTEEEGECPEGYSWNTCAYSCNQLCLAYGAELKQRGYCRTSEGCAPGCVEEEETDSQTFFRNRGCSRGNLWRDARTCVPARDCTCRTPFGKIIAPGAVEESDDVCEVCQCLDNEYVCDNSRCSYSWSTPSIDAVKNLTVITTPKPRPIGPTKAPTSCSGWSDWINEYQKPAWGDYESKSVAQLNKKGFCLTGKIADIECRDAKTDQLWTESRNKDLVCSLEKGFTCMPARQGKGRPCQDYKIRYFCECSGGDEGLSITTATIATTTTPRPTTTIMIWSTTKARPRAVDYCPDEHLMPLLSNPLTVPDSAFVATTSKSGVYGPSSARFVSSGRPKRFAVKVSKSDLAWVAGKRDMFQHIQVDLGIPTFIYGFEISGSPANKEYVTSLFVLYSEDNQRFSYVPNRKGKPRLFRGPLEHDGRKKNMFDAPIEARYIRLEPQTWKHAIALRFDLFACNITSESVQLVTTPKPLDDVCNDQMGLENGVIDDQQITLSSVNASFNQLRLGSDSAWMPAINSRKEHVQFDFLEPRNLSGIVTQGHADGHSWIESYAVRYSSDGETWFTVLNDDSTQRVFHANVDGNTPTTNMFDRLIHARYLKIVPWSWHEAISLRMDILGCYEPITATLPPTLPPTTTTPTTPLPKFCHPCPNIPDDHLNIDHCACPLSQKWNGTGCVHASQCPCFDGHTKYSVGAIYQAHDSCSQCVCRLGGVSDCQKPTCPSCEPGMLSYLSEHPTCKCLCKPCGAGTRLCQSSNVCLNETLWCNGVEDCPDDERNCATTTPEPVECLLAVCAEGYIEKNTGLFSNDGCPIYNCAPPASRPTGAPCPEPSCPAGFILELQMADYDTQQTGQAHQDYDHLSQNGQQHMDYDQQSNGDLGQLSQSTDDQQSANQESCPPYKCVPEHPKTTPTPVTLPPLVERDDRCSMTGRMFRTFDGTEYSYDVCHHVMMRDMLNDLWSVSVHDHCPATETGCSRLLRIDHNKEIIELLPGLKVGYKGFEYSILQAEQIASLSPDFSIHRVGDSVLFRSEAYSFWIVWDIHSNVKIGVTSKLLEHIDGLCGYYNLKSYDDQRTPEGTLAKSTKEFGDSWSIEDSECAPIKCPVSFQTAAWDKCSFLRQDPFSQCHGSDEAALDKAIFRCVDIMCDCMGTLKDKLITEIDAADTCACQAMSVMAVECHDELPTVDLTGWRSKYDCAIDCGTDGSVYKECNKKKCERSCQNNKNPHPCPPMPDLCYPGCVCPDGLVRHSDGKCVKPSECRDCVCDAFGDPHYISFDRNNFTFGGNCSYVAARDKLSKLESKIDHDFQVLVTNSECNEDGKTSCTDAVTILYQDHVINVRHSEQTHSVMASMDGVPVDNFPVHLPWVRVEKLPGEQVSVLLMAIQVEVSYYMYSRGFKIRLPSQLYLNKTEGLCGNCNSDFDDDSMSNQAGLGWLVNKLLREPPTGEEDLCQIAPQPECTPLNPNQDPCLKLLDSDLFKMCNAVVDPLPYIAACQYDTCKSSDPVSAACPSFESYARECSRYQVCLNWRSSQLCPIECPSGMEYQQCGSGCQSICGQDKDLTFTCPMSVNDGCYCPSGHAFNQELGRCVPQDHCVPCDTEGHYKGDHWKPDACTTCSCDDDGHVQCVKRSCALEECPPDHERTIIQPENECCPTVRCMKEENLLTKKPCPEVPVPRCGQYQVLRYQNIDGCPRQVCECIPFDECPPMDTPAANPLVGVSYHVNTTGCCYHLDRVCSLDECPPKPECLPFYEVEVKASWEELCCPEFICVPPKDVCVYEHVYAQHQNLKILTTTTPQPKEKQKKGVKGKRSIQFRQDSIVQQYSINATWKDGPCLECTCLMELNNPIPRTTCTATNCPEPVDDDYAIKAEPVPDNCCPRHVRIACRQGSNTHQVGETWQSPSGDPCQTYICLEGSDGTIIKQLQIESCPTCPSGWEYQTGNSSVCCGTCQQVACVSANGSQHAVGSTWKADLCTKISCVIRDNGLQMESLRENCDKPTDDDIYNYETITPQNQCCPVYKRKSCLHNGREYQVNETWSTNDQCVTMVCNLQADGQVSRQEVMLSCPPASECVEGYEYEPPSPTECCGKCVQVACVLNGTLHPIGSSWNPDSCTFYSCVGSRGHGHVTESQVLCSPIGDCPEKNRIRKPDECCPICNATESQKNCLPEEVALEKTVGYVVHDSVMHGKCVNVEPVHGLTECVGHCQSKTVHEPNSIDPTSHCECCQAEETKELKTTLTCSDGKTWVQVLRVPTSCTCNLGCNGSADLQALSNPLVQAENLLLATQEEQNLESLTQLVQNQLKQQHDNDQLQIVQQQRQGRGDAIARKGGQI